MAGIGLVAATSLFIYLPIIHRDSEYLPLVRSPSFKATDVWTGFSDALVAPSSAKPNETSEPQIWIWIGLLLAAIIVAVLLHRTGRRQSVEQEFARSANRERS